MNLYKPTEGFHLTICLIIHWFLREQRVKARRNNKELLREETDYLKQYLDISRVRTAQVAEGEISFPS